MRRLLWLPPIGLGLLLAHGCSSTLDEYRCTVAAECIDDEGQGICHSSGYCAFVDFDECDGYRFGKLSGERSNQCVEGDGELDAGLREPDADVLAPDASTPNTRPIAVINPISLACGNTTVTLNGSNSMAVGDASLVNFAWTLRSPTGAIVDTLSGPPANYFLPSANFYTGHIDRPTMNLTPYQGDKAAFVDTKGDEAEIYQTLTIPAGSHRLSFAAASEPGATTTSPFQYIIELDPTTEIVSGSITLTEEMTTYTLDINSFVPLQGVEIVFSTASGAFWVDAVRVYQIAANGSDAVVSVSNPSFQSGLTAWTTELDGLNASAAANSVPSNFANYGDYQIELVVIDSNEQTSEPAIVTVNHAACGNGGGDG